MGQQDEILSRRRELRQRAPIKRMLVFGTLIVFGIPLILVILNLFFGWKPAVLAMPAAFLAAAFWDQFKNRHKRKAGRRKAGVAQLGFLFALCGLPVLAVYFDERSIMRLWAAFVMIAMIEENFFMVRSHMGRTERDLPADAVGVLVTTAIFVGASEVLWHLAPFWLWLVFHGSVLLGLTCSIWAGAALTERLFPRSVRKTVTDPKKPPRSENGDRSERLPLRIAIAERHWLDYGKVRKSQAEKIVAGLEETLFSPHGNEVPWDTLYPRLEIDVHLHELTIIRYEADRYAVNARFQNNPRRLMCGSKTLHLNSAFYDDVKELLRLVWRDDWRSINKKMKAAGAVEAERK